MLTRGSIRCTVLVNDCAICVRYGLLKSKEQTIDYILKWLTYVFCTLCACPGETPSITIVSLWKLKCNYVQTLQQGNPN